MRETAINALTALAVSVATLFVPVGAAAAPIAGGVVFGTLQSKDGIRTNARVGGLLGGVIGVVTFLFAAGLFSTTPILAHATLTVQGIAVGFLAELHPAAYALIAGGVSWIAFTSASLIVSEFDFGGGKGRSTTSP